MTVRVGQRYHYKDWYYDFIAEIVELPGTYLVIQTITPTANGSHGVGFKGISSSNCTAVEWVYLEGQDKP